MPGRPFKCSSPLQHFPLSVIIFNFGENGLVRSALRLRAKCEVKRLVDEAGDVGVDKFLGSDSCYEDVVGGVVGDSEEDGIAPLQLRESVCLEGLFIV